MTLGSPHLGMRFGANVLVGAGARVLNTVTPSPCLSELLLADAREPAECALSKMAAEPVLVHFRHVILLSSPQDGYIPRSSARMERSPAALADRRCALRTSLRAAPPRPTAQSAVL
jgi:hypothetical protein